MTAAEVSSSYRVLYFTHFPTGHDGGCGDCSGGGGGDGGGGGGGDGGGGGS